MYATAEGNIMEMQVIALLNNVAWLTVATIEFKMAHGFVTDTVCVVLLFMHLYKITLHMFGKPNSK